MVQIPAVGLVLAEILTYLIDQKTNSLGNLVLSVIVTNKMDDYPVILGETTVVFMRHELRNFDAPVAWVGKIAFFIRFKCLAIKNKGHVISVSRLESKPDYFVNCHSSDEVLEQPCH